MPFEVPPFLWAEVEWCDRRAGCSACCPEAAHSAIPDKLGFQHETTLRRRSEDTEGTMHDSMVWSLFRDEYAKSPAREKPVAAYDCLGASLL